MKTLTEYELQNYILESVGNEWEFTETDWEDGELKVYMEKDDIVMLIGRIFEDDNIFYPSEAGRNHYLNEVRLIEEHEQF